MLLWSIRLPLLDLAVELPRPMMTFVGRFVPAGPRLQKETVLLLFPVVVVVLKRIFPPAVVTGAVDDPNTEHLVTTLLDAPLMKRIVLTPAVAEVLVFLMVNELPPVLSPSIVTLLAPLRLINAPPPTVPEMVRAPIGLMVIDV